MKKSQLSSISYVVDKAQFETLEDLSRYLKNVFLIEELTNEKLVHTNKLLSTLGKTETLSVKARAKKPRFGSLTKKCNQCGAIFTFNPKNRTGVCDTCKYEAQNTDLRGQWSIKKTMGQQVFTESNPNLFGVFCTRFVEKEKENYIEKYFSVLGKSSRSVSLVLNSINSLSFESAFKNCLHTYLEKFKSHIDRNQIRCDIILIVETSRNFNRSNTKVFYKDALESEMNRKFFGSKLFEYFLRHIDSELIKIYVRGEEYPQLNNVFIVDDHIVFKEEYAYNSGKIQPMIACVGHDQDFLEPYQLQIKEALKPTNILREGFMKLFVDTQL